MSTSKIDGARQYAGEPGAMIAGDTDPWLQTPDGEVVDLGPHLAQLPPGPCEDRCPGAYFAPTGTGPTYQGVERCDACDVYAGDFDAAMSLASHIGPDVTVWFLPAADHERCSR